MDLSKLPKLSETPKPADPPPPSTAPHPGPAPRAPVSVGGEVWLSFAIGAIVLYLYPYFLQWATGNGGGIPAINDVATGQVIPYAQSHRFLGDVGMSLFGMALILDGVVLLLRRPWGLWVGLAVTGLAVLINVGAIVQQQSLGYALNLPALVAVAVGVYVAIYQWRMLREIGVAR